MSQPATAARSEIETATIRAISWPLDRQLKEQRTTQKANGLLRASALRNRTCRKILVDILKITHDPAQVGLAKIPLKDVTPSDGAL